MSLYELFVGGIVTTALGMGVTFVALIALQYITGLFGKLSVFRDPPTQEVRKKPAPARAQAPVQTPSASNSEELVAVISTSLAMMLETPASNLRIRSITRVQDASPVWWRMGVVDQMHNNL
jgi:sodium pump decarboxylase gamma subunit